MKPELKEKQNKILKELRSVYGIKAVDNFQLTDIGRQLIGRKFCGVYAYDQYPIHTQDCTYAIINTDNSRQSGTHWLGIFKKEKTLYIFDSFGRFSKNVLKKLIQITGLLLIILTIIYLVIGSYVAYKTYVEPTLKPATVPE